MVLIALSPDKFVVDGDQNHFDEGGVNFRWIPWTASGFEFLQGLAPSERKVAARQMCGTPFFLTADVARAMWLRYVQWPWQKRSMQAAGPDRKRAIDRNSASLAKSLDTLVLPDSAAFAALLRARDLEFLLRSIHAQGVEPVVLLLPDGNRELMGRTHTVEELAKRDSIGQRMRGWLGAREVAYLDFDTRQELAQFPDSAWDDQVHLRDPAALGHISEVVGRWMAGRETSRARVPTGGIAGGRARVPTGGIAGGRARQHRPEAGHATAAGGRREGSSRQ